VEKGWDAKGLLKPLWGRVGGRDGLARLTGITGETLSGYNTGRLPLGRKNAERIADALSISVAELGAPAPYVAEDELTLHERVSLLEQRVELLEALNRVEEEPARAAEAMAVLEQRLRRLRDEAAHRQPTEPKRQSG